MDNLLLRLLNARDEHERQQRLEELLTIHVAPIIRQVLRQRLGLHVNAQGINPNNHDAEDLYQEAMTRIVEVLNADQLSLTKIENFERYVGRIVSNTCVDFLRSKYPIRARMKDALLYVFRRHRNLASWPYEDEILCGFAAWRNTGKQAEVADGFETKLDAFLAARFADEDVKVVSLSRLVAELFEWIGGAVQIDVLVRMLVYLRDIREQQIESLDDDVTAEFEVRHYRRTGSPASDIEIHELLGRLWHITKRLTPKQRDAFALRFQDPAGRNFFTVLLDERIVEWKDLTEGMERSVEELAHLCTKMPMDSTAIAGELRTSRDNIYKWRFRAIQKLRAELK